MNAYSKYSTSPTYSLWALTPTPYISDSQYNPPILPTHRQCK